MKKYAAVAAAGLLSAPTSAAGDASKQSFRASSGCGSTPPATPGTTTTLSGTFDGVKRTWRVYVPSSYSSDTAVPLVVSTHGWGGSGKQDESGSGLTTTGGNYIAVFPDGYADNSNFGSWGSWNCVGSTLSPGPDGQTCTSSADPKNTYCYQSCNGCKGADGCDWTTCIDDITSTGIGATDVNGFIPQLYDYMEENFCIDTTREYHSGFSNGGMFTYQAGASMSSRLAAIAPVAGSFHNGFNQAPTSKVPLLDIHGVNDKTVPANSTTSADGWHYTPINSGIVPNWVKANGCSSPVASPYTGSLGISASDASKYQLGCVDWGCDVVSCAWSGSHQYFGSASLNGNLVWSFLSQFTKPDHIGKGLQVGEKLPAGYKLRLMNVSIVVDSDAKDDEIYRSTGIDITNPPPGFTFSFSSLQDSLAARPHYGNPSFGCKYDEDKILLQAGDVQGEVCAPRRKTRRSEAASGDQKNSSELGDDSFLRSCTLGGMSADSSNGCPTDIPAVNNGTLSAYPQCAMDDKRAGLFTNLAHCYLTCDPCRDNGFDDCDDSAHDMCPQGAACMLGLVKNVKQGICVYNSNARPAKYHLGETYSDQCYETTYNDTAFATQGYVAGECDPVFTTIDNVAYEVVCDGDSNENIKDCPNSQITIAIAKKGKA